MTAEEGETGGQGGRRWALTTTVDIDSWLM